MTVRRSTRTGDKNHDGTTNMKRLYRHLPVILVVATLGCTTRQESNSKPQEQSEDAEAAALDRCIEAEARASKYAELYEAAIRFDTNNERCNDLRRFLADQLPRDDAVSDTGYLFRFSFHAFFGKCLVRDAKNDKMYAVTAENIELAMFLDKNFNLRIPPMKPPED